MFGLVTCISSCDSSPAVTCSRLHASIEYVCLRAAQTQSRCPDIARGPHKELNVQQKELNVQQLPHIYAMIACVTATCCRQSRATKA